ncbi:MAG: phosphoribosylformylglycinamidine cyclo-ligase [Calditrichaeota bacterium]|nr:phosphoribosylformylglycinamidine cyclo-ligase [Calditrichota bacterium]
MEKRMTYRQAGVDIEKAEQALERLKRRIARTYTPEVISGVGLFGGFYRFPAGDYRSPVLVSSTDGVGTKIKVAILAGKHDTIGQDLVNHCINDIAVCGARPLFFLDYFASGQLDASVYEAVVGGIARACEYANIPLIGGETAEMPDFYQPGEYDISGTIVGAVEEANLIDGSTIQPGDLLIGAAASGLHTNGYTLARKVLLKHFSVDTYVAELGCTLAEELLKIHRNYYPLIQQVVSRYTIKGMAHITGGGLVKNTRRLLRETMDVEIHWDTLPRYPVFELIKKLGNVPDEDMRQTFNMGIGLVLITSVEEGERLLASEGLVREYGLRRIGRIVSRS